jgi:hypothetical protein
MLKKPGIALAIIFILVLAACAPKAQALPPAAIATSYPAQGDVSGIPQASNTLESRLAIGILKMEGTNQAVTADQARILLPLWQQVQTMVANSATNPTDLQTVYQKIEGTLTPAQITAIEGVSLNQADIQTFAQSLGIQITPFPTLSANELATRQAQPTLSPEQQATRQAQRGNRGGGTGGFPAGTPGAFSGRGGFGGFGMEQMFISPLITLLQQRAGG